MRIVRHALYADDGAKTFFAHNLHRVVYIAQNGRGEIVALARKGFAAKKHLCALALGIRDLPAQHGQLSSARQRPDVSRLVQRLPNLEPAHCIYECRSKSRINACLHVDTLDRTTALTGVIESAVRE